ncbi:MAG TPA: hypothetical protein VK660_03640 [Xanthomonadaceae bacterium]|nr:hypothetical protein [Xanthomonadaceae bacterium]
MEQVNAVSTVATEAHPRMCWGAIFAGWLVAVGIAEMLYLGGFALGFSAFDAHNAAESAKGIGMGTAAWVVLTWVASLFLGGMFASWFDGKNDTTMGTMHGVAVWGLSVAVSGLVFASGVHHATHEGMTMASAGMHSAAMAADRQERSGGMMVDAVTVVRAQLDKAVGQSGTIATSVPSATATPTAGGLQDAAQLAPDDATPGPMGFHRPMMHGEMDAVAVALLTGNTATAHDLLVAETSLAPADVDRVLQAESAQVEKYKADAQLAADKAAHHTAVALGIAFMATLLSLVFAAIGGWLGANHIHRVYHLRTYVRQPNGR